MNRRGFLQGILSAGVAPYVCTAAGVLMPVKKIVTAPSYLTDPDAWHIITDKQMAIEAIHQGDLIVFEPGGVRRAQYSDMPLRKLFVSLHTVRSGQVVPVWPTPQ